MGGPKSPAGQNGLPATGYSLPQLLKNNGYVTGLIGKWHLGYKPEFSPNAHGFDYFFGFKSGYIDYYQHTNSDGDSDLFENESYGFWKRPGVKRPAKPSPAAHVSSVPKM